tara:strand:- start:662 stop:892 length:231 start_codon:yes stop_codon:yes gene_type:complete
MIDLNSDTVRPLNQYAKKFNVGNTTLRNWRKDHDFPAFRLAGGWYSSDNTVAKWMIEQQTKEQTRGKHLQKRERSS